MTQSSRLFRSNTNRNNYYAKKVLNKLDKFKQSERPVASLSYVKSGPQFNRNVYSRQNINATELDVNNTSQSDFQRANPQSNQDGNIVQKINQINNRSGISGVGANVAKFCADQMRNKATVLPDVVKIAQILNTNSSSNILVDGSLITSPITVGTSTHRNTQRIIPSSNELRGKVISQQKVVVETKKQDEKPNPSEEYGVGKNVQKDNEKVITYEYTKLQKQKIQQYYNSYQHHRPQQHSSMMSGTFNAHQSQEQSQFIHGSSIDEGPTSPRGNAWGNVENTSMMASLINTDRDIEEKLQGNQEEKKDDQESQIDAKGRKLQKQKKSKQFERVTLTQRLSPNFISKSLQNRQPFPKSLLHLKLQNEETRNINKTLNETASNQLRTLFSDQSFTKLHLDDLSNNSSLQQPLYLHQIISGNIINNPSLPKRDEFSPAHSNLQLRPESTKHRVVSRPFNSKDSYQRLCRDQQNPIFIPSSSKKPRESRVVNYKSCSSQNILRMNAFDQKVWAPNIKGYLSIDNRVGSRVMKDTDVTNLKQHSSPQSINMRLRQLIQQQFNSLQQQHNKDEKSMQKKKHIIMPMNTSLSRVNIMPFDNKNQDSRTSGNSYNKQRLTTSVLSKHRSNTRNSGIAGSALDNANSSINSKKQNNISKHTKLSGNLVISGVRKETNNKSNQSINTLEDQPFKRNIQQISRSKSVNTQTQQQLLLLQKQQQQDRSKDFSPNNYIDSSAITSSNPYLSNQSSHRLAQSNTRLKKQNLKASQHNYTSQYASNQTIITNKQKTSRQYLQSQVNQSLDYSQTGGNTQTCLQPKGISSVSALRTFSSNQSQQAIQQVKENQKIDPSSSSKIRSKFKSKNIDDQDEEDEYYNTKVFANKQNSVSSVPSSLKEHQEKRFSQVKSQQISEVNHAGSSEVKQGGGGKKNIPGFKFQVEVKKQINFTGDNIREAKKGRKGKKRKSKLMKSVGVMSDQLNSGQEKSQGGVIQNPKQNVGSSDQSQIFNDKYKKENRYKQKKRDTQSQNNSITLRMKQFRIQTPTDNMILDQSIGGHFGSIISPTVRHQKFHSVDVFRPSTSSPKSMTGGGGNMRVFKGIAIASNSPSAQNIQNFHNFNQNLNSIMPPVTPPGLRRMLSQSLIEHGSPKEEIKNQDLLPQKAMQQTGTFGHKESTNIFGQDSQYKSIEQHQMSLRQSHDFPQGYKNQQNSSRSPSKNAKLNQSVNNQIRKKIYTLEQGKNEDGLNKSGNLAGHSSKSPKNQNINAGKFSNTNSPSIKKRVISKYYEGGKKKKLFQQPHTHPLINSINAIEFTGNSSPHPPSPIPQNYHPNMTPTAAQDGRNLSKLDLSAAPFSGGVSIGNIKHLPAGGISSLYRSQFSDGTSHLSSILDPQTNLGGINSQQIISIQTNDSPTRINMAINSTPNSKKHKTPQPPQIPPISEKKLAELIPTESSPQASPMLHQRVLPDSKFHSFGLLESKNNLVDSNILGLRLIQNLSNEQEDEDGTQKKVWRPEELISPNFSYSKDNKQTHGLPTATFDSNNNKSLSSGKNMKSQKQNNEMRVKMRRLDQNQDEFRQMINAQSVEVIKKGQQKGNMMLRNKKMIRSSYLQKRVPLSLSNFEFQPMEKLDYQEIEQLIDQPQPPFGQLPHTTHHSKKSSFTFNYMSYQNPSSKAQSKGESAAMKRNSQIPPKIKRPFIGSKNLAAPVAPQDLSPYSSKHGRITKRSAGAWCQFPQSMLSQEDRIRINAASGNGNGKVIWGFYSAGAQDWSAVLKKMSQASRPTSAAPIAQSCKKLLTSIQNHQILEVNIGNDLNDRQSTRPIVQSSKHNSRRGTRPMSTPQQRQKTIAIKMKTVSYQNTDSVTTSKDYGVIPNSGVRKNQQIGNMRGSLSQDLLKSRAYNNSLTDANLISEKTLVPYIQQHEIKSNQLSMGLIFKGKQLSRSATPSLSKLKNSGSETPGKINKIKKNLKSRAKSTTFISHLQPVVVEEEPLQQADITSRHLQRLGSIA